MKAMILAAGLGSRLKPQTDHTPKALINVNGIPMIAHIINRLRKFGFTDIIVNVHHLAQQIIDFVHKQDYKDLNIHFSDESSALLDTGGGILNASWFLEGNEPFLVHNVDIFTDLDLSVLYHDHKKSNAISTLAVSDRKTSRYLLFDQDLRLMGWKNMKTNEVKLPGSKKDFLHKLAFSGIQVLSPGIFPYLKSFSNKSIKFSIIELYLQISESVTIKGFDHSGGKWIDMGKKESYPLPKSFLNTL